MSDYTVKITIKNGRILQLMRAAGIPSVAELSRRSGMAQTRIGQIINLKRAPLLQDGTWVAGVEDLAGVLGCDPEAMFSEHQRTLALEDNTRDVEMTEPQVIALAGGADVEQQTWAKIETQRLLSCLSPRSQDIVERRFAGETLEEIGTDLHLSRDRIRQIEDRALRQMRATADRDAKRLNEPLVPARVSFTPNPDWEPRAVRERREREAAGRPRRWWDAF